MRLQVGCLMYSRRGHMPFDGALILVCEGFWWDGLLIWKWYQMQDDSENCGISGGSYPSGGKHMVCTVSTFPMPSFKILYTYPTILTTIKGQAGLNKTKEICFSLTGAIRAIRNAQGGVLDSVLALVMIMMSMMIVVVRWNDNSSGKIWSRW